MKRSKLRKRANPTSGKGVRRNCLTPMRYKTNGMAKSTMATNKMEEYRNNNLDSNLIKTNSFLFNELVPFSRFWLPKEFRLSSIRKRR